MKYSFASREEAERFLEGLKREMIPNRGELAKASVPFAGAGLVAADAAVDVKRYLDAYSSKYRSTTFKGDVRGKVEIKADPVDIEVKGAACAGGDGPIGHAAWYTTHRSVVSSVRQPGRRPGSSSTGWVMVALSQLKSGWHPTS